MKISEKLKIIRQNLSISQKEFAKKLGIALSTYQYYERDERTPSADLIVRLITTIRVNPEWFFYNKGTVFTSPVEPRITESNINQIRELIVEWVDQQWDTSSFEEKIWFIEHLKKHFPEFEKFYLDKAKIYSEQSQKF